MTEPEHFDLINDKCDCILELVYEAETTTDMVRARDLYGKAFQVADDIINALRGRIDPFDELAALIRSAA